MAEDHGASPGGGDLPPVPESRSITPAPEDFASPPPLVRLLWPLLWIGVGILLVVAAFAWGWRVHDGGAH